MTTGKAHKTSQKNDTVRHQPFFQPKLTIGPTDDAYEKEADRVAAQVMRMSINKGDTFFSPRPWVSSRWCKANAPLATEKKKERNKISIDNHSAR